MVNAAMITAGLTTRSAPAKDRPSRPAPERITEILAVLSVLTTYGRHLAQTLQQRAVGRGFVSIARYFGTVAFDTILAHLHRGLMRAIALERMLLRRAARGRDLRILARRAPSRREPPATDTPVTGQTAGPALPEALTPDAEATAQAAASEAEARVARRMAANEPLTLDTLPSMEEMDAEVLRNPVGRSIAAICRDFGVSPSLCDGMFWNRLFDAIRLYRGNLAGFVLEVKRCEQQFDKEEWKYPGRELPEETSDGIRRILGFFIGEPPVDPFAVRVAPGARVAATATGPP
jgi:hypothetical protein